MSEHLKSLGYLFEEAFAEMRGVKVATLRNERALGKGPPYVTMGNRTVYPIAGVKAWMEARMVQPEGAPTLSTGFARRRSRRTAA